MEVWLPVEEGAGEAQVEGLGEGVAREGVEEKGEYGVVLVRVLLLLRRSPHMRWFWMVCSTAEGSPPKRDHAWSGTTL